MKPRFSAFTIRLFPLLFATVSLFIACQLTQSTKVENTVSFDKQFAVLSQYDSVQIIVKDSQGNVSDTVFHGPVKSKSDLMNLDAPHYDGKTALITIIGFKNKETVYRVEKNFDGTKNTVDTTVSIILPGTSLTLDTTQLEMYLGDSLPLPKVSVAPAELSNKALNWASNHTEIVSVDPVRLIAKSVGSADLTISLQSDPTKSVKLTVQVLPITVQSLHFATDSLVLFLGDSEKPLSVVVLPAKANQGVDFSIQDSTKAMITGDRIKGLAEGVTVVTARSLEIPATTGTIKIVVKSTQVVDSVLSVKIISPATNTYTNQASIDVAWSIDNAAQDSLLKEILSVGKNVIKRSALDKSGKEHSDSVIVIRDTTAPNPPIVNGTTPTNVLPQWNWSSGGGGGTGDYRYKIGDENFATGALTGKDSTFTMKDAPVSGTTYILYVQEKDQAGNWSVSSSLAIKYDLTKPILTISAPQASGTYYTNAATIDLNGLASGPLPIAKVTYKIGSGAPANAAFASGAWSISGVPLVEGVPCVLTVTAVDNAGNFGDAVLTVLMDNTVPSAPTITLAPAALNNSIAGSWAWTAGNDGANGSGLNGKFRYMLNGGAWKDTTGSLVNNLALIEGSNLFSLQEQDKSGLWSTSATSVIKVDTTGPVFTVTSHSNPANIAATHITLSGTVSDPIAGVQALSISGQTAGSGAVTLSGGAWTSADLTLKSGANVLVLNATDVAGNSRSLNFTVNVNVPASKVIITDPADDLTLTSKDTITVKYTLDGAAKTQVFNLVEGLNSLVVASPANESGAIGKDTVKVTKDATPPKVPSLSISAANTNGTATWTWASRGDSAGGAGVTSAFRYAINGGATTSTSSTSHQETVEGVYTLTVQEQDKAGNWSPSVSKTISIDKSAPVVTITSPVDGFITNDSVITVNYTEKDSTKAPVAKSKVVSLTSDNAQNTVTIASTADAAGNVGSASISVWRRSKVLFVKAGATGNGSSWDNAAGLAGALAKAKSGSQIWVGAGVYKTATTSGFVLTNGVAVYGGFPIAGNPTALAQRDSAAPYKSILRASTAADTVVNVSWIQNGDTNIVINGFQIDGGVSSEAQIGVYLSLTTSFQIANCDILGFSINALNLVGTGEVRNCNIHDNFATDEVVSALVAYPTENEITFTGCTFSNNHFGFAVVYFADGGRLTFSKTNFLDTVNPTDPSTPSDQVRSNAPYPEAVLTFLNCKVKGGVAAIDHGGTLNYDSSNTNL